jgi:hypothetical protein
MGTSPKCEGRDHHRQFKVTDVNSQYLLIAPSGRAKG